MRIQFPLIVLVAAVCTGPASAEPLPPGPDIVPPTALGFVSVRVSALHDADALKPVREAIARLEKTEGGLEKQFGVTLDQIDRVTLFWPSLGGDESGLVPVIVVTTRGPFNEAKVLQGLKALPPGRDRGRRGPAIIHEALKPTAKSASGASGPPRIGPGNLPLGPAPGAPDIAPPPKVKGPGNDGASIGDEPPVPKSPPLERLALPATKEALPSVSPELFFIERGPYSAVYLLDDRTLVFLPSPQMDEGATLLNLVGQLLRRKADGPLSEALAETGKHTIVAAVRVDKLEQLIRGGRDFPRELVPYRSLLKAQTVVVTADVGAQAVVTARLTFVDAASARRAESALATLMQHGVELLADLRRELRNDAETSAVVAPLINLASVALDKAEVKLDGSVVTARISAELGPTVTKAMAALPDFIEVATARQKTLNNLKQIGIAFHNYHDVNGFMPADVLDPTGKPLLSWRVQILPYIEQDNMYRQLDLTKAWDDPRNAKILEKMPDVYRVFGRETKEKGQTYLQMPTAIKRQGNVPFHVRGEKMTFAHITDGLSNTLMVVEAADPVSWAKPDDLIYNPLKLPKLGDPQRTDFFVLFGDGSVRILRRDKLTDEQLKALITVNGGEIVNLDQK
jgi:Protein of unknown function (DUF1559)